MDFNFNNNICSITNRQNAYSAFCVDDEQIFPSGLAPLSKPQRRYLARGVTIFEFWNICSNEEQSRKTADSPPSGDKAEHLLGIAKVRLRPLYQKMKANAKQSQLP